jgi:hypothetical protein
MWIGQATFNKVMVSSSGAVCDGMCATHNHTSIHSSFYALAFGLIDHTTHRLPVAGRTVLPPVAAATAARSALAVSGSTFEYITKRLADDPDGYPGGAYPIQFLLVALYSHTADLGHAGYRVLTSTKKHGWIAMMRDFNATTTMECWSPEELPNLSFSHIWSASPTFVVPWLLAGVQPLLPGWAKISIKPQPGLVKPLLRVLLRLFRFGVLLLSSYSVLLFAGFLLACNAAPCALGVQAAPCALGVQAAPCALGVQAAPCALGVQAAPCALGVPAAPCVLGVQAAPCVLGVHAAPCALGVQAEPCALDLQAAPCALGVQAAPCARFSELLSLQKRVDQKLVVQAIVHWVGFEFPLCIESV